MSDGVKQKQVEALIRQAAPGAGGQIALLILIGVVLIETSFPSDVLILLVLLGIVLQSIRFVRTQALRKQTKPFTVDTQAHIATFEALAGGVIWSFLFVGMEMYTPVTYHVLAIAYGLGMAGAAIVTIGYQFRVYSAFVTPFMLTLVATSLLHDDRIHTVLAIATFLGFIYLLFTAKRYNVIYQELLQQNLKAQQINEAKDAFLANMSHELRTPMNAILGLNELILQTHLDKKQRGLMRQLDRSSKSMLSILNDILDHLKVEENKLDIVKERFNVTQLIYETCDLFAPTAEQKGLRLKVEISPGVPCYLLGDALRIKQVLSNLISNAIKFTDNGEVVLKAEAAPMRSKGPQYFNVNFSVSDTGIGLSEAEQQKLFQPFVQADSTITKKYGGTGLGLSICQGLADLMDGKFYVVSSKGQGSVFILELVMKEMTAPVTSDAGKISMSDFLAKAKEMLTGLSVLMVEDHYVNQKVLKSQLNQLGIKPVLTNNGQEALDYLAQKPKVELVLMDMHMPVMGGVEATKLIHAQDIWQDLPIVAVSAAAMDHDKKICEKAGMVDFLSKPISAVNLACVLLKHGKGIEFEEEVVSDPVEDSAMDRRGLLKLSDLAEKTGIVLEELNPLIEKFVEEYQTFETRAVDLIDVEDWIELEFYLHQLNGVVSSLKFLRLREEVSFIEKQLQQNGHIRTGDLTMLIEQLQEVIHFYNKQL